MKKLFYVGITLFFGLILPLHADAAVYYIDCVNGNDTNDGLGTTTANAWLDIDTFTDSARSAGDIAFVRRGGTGCDDATDLVLASDGTFSSPIIISSDYDNLWNDFATSSQTVTPDFGSKFMATSASTTSMFPNTWIYLSGDCVETYNATSRNDCKYAYEIETASTTGISLYLPYKGQQAGSGIAARVMPASPVWGTAAGVCCSVLTSSDNFWTFQGLDMRSSDNGGIFDASGDQGHFLNDMVFQSDGTGDDFYLGASDAEVYVYRGRSFDTDGLELINVAGVATVRDFYFDANNDSSNEFPGASNKGLYSVFDLEVANLQSTTHVVVTSEAGITTFRNLVWDGSGDAFHTTAGISGSSKVFIEDAVGEVGGNRVYSSYGGTNSDNVIIASSTKAILRPGGSSVSAVFSPATSMSANTPYSLLKLFEYPIYTDDSSKTYTMYFNSTSTAAWTTDPTADEFWIECEYYNETSGADRILKKSTGVVDFNGSTDWQSLAVTCDPTQAGILYLRGFYGKPKETPMNEFYMDTRPEIS